MYTYVGVKPIVVVLVGLLLGSVAVGCASSTAEERGMITPTDRAVAPPQQGLRTDGPTQPRTSTQRPPERGHGGETGP